MRIAAPTSRNTGKKLADYFGPGRENAAGARLMVNPDEHGPEIAATHRAFVSALRTAGHKPGGVATTIPVGKVEIAPLQPPAAPTFAPRPAPPADSVTRTAPAAAIAPPAPAKLGFWASALGRLRGKYPPQVG